MNSSFNNFIELLKKNVIDYLPGVEAHKLMMPEGRRFDYDKNNPPIDSAVLIALYEKNNQILFSLILRPKYNGHHSGQMALPGGKVESADSTLIETALRETEEEVGINREEIKIIGTLSELYIPITNLKVLPVLGYLNHEPKYILNRHEVDAIFEIDINDIVNDATKCHEIREIQGNTIGIPFYSLQSQKVWGVTAMILSEFEQVIKRCMLSNN